jgi:hypothetical protein
MKRRKGIIPIWIGIKSIRLLRDFEIDDGKTLGNIIGLTGERQF